LTPNQSIGQFRRIRGKAAHPEARDRKRRLGRGGAAVLLCATALLSAGCGTGGIVKGGDASTGKQLFVAKCGGCHALADAGTNGAVGPNLDDAFAYDRQQGYEDSTIEQVVRDQIEIAGGRMPKNIYTGQNADDVAAYVASVAGVPGKGGKLTSGKDIFVANCGSCHTLKDAGTTGKVGPNLDDLMPAFARVQKQVINGGAVMPAFKGKLTDAQIKAVAQYVSSKAGK
jgi:cbb3-type cytochrome c oxidase subunit III